MPIIKNDGKALGVKPERQTLTIEDTDFLIRTLTEATYPGHQVIMASKVLTKLQAYQSELMEKTVKI